MNVIIDTSVWSLAWRKATNKDSKVMFNLTELIRENRVRMIGPIRQELLSGIKTDNQFEQLKSYLSNFPDIPLERRDYEKAAEFFNICQRHGVQGSNTDFLICAVANRSNLEIYTGDKDFFIFHKFLPITLYSVSANRHESN